MILLCKAEPLPISILAFSWSHSLSMLTCSLGYLSHKILYVHVASGGLWCYVWLTMVRVVVAVEGCVDWVPFALFGVYVCILLSYVLVTIAWQKMFLPTIFACPVTNDRRAWATKGSEGAYNFQHTRCTCDCYISKSIFVVNNFLYMKLRFSLCINWRPMTSIIYNKQRGDPNEPPQMKKL